MSEQLTATPEKTTRLSMNPAKLAMQGWRMVKRHEQLGQISYVNLRLRADYSNCDSVITGSGDYAILAERLESGGGLRKVEYVREDEAGRSSVRRVTIINEENAKARDIEHIIIDDTPLDGGETVTRTYAGHEGLRSETDFPFVELERELTAVYKDAKPHLWPEDPFWL